MGRFGLSKKSEDGDADSNRLALFGSRSKNKSPAPAPANPYAQPIPPDPYTEAKVKAGAMRGAPQDHGNPGNFRDQRPPGDRYGTPDNRQGYNAPPSGYAPNRGGDQGGYGRDRYGGGGGDAGGGSRYGAGGYGGLGNADPNDDNREALFGGVRERQARQPGNGAPSYGSRPGLPPDSSTDGGMGGGANQSYGTYGTYQERQLTAEEEEEEDVQATKQDIRFMKQEDVSSTRNALRAAAQAEESGRNTLARLGAQGERIHNAEKNLDLAANQNRIAEEKARELKRVNKSMFSVHVSNPFTSEQRRLAREEAILDRHQQERIQREETRRAAFRTEQRMEQTFREMSKQGPTPKAKAANLAERSKYQFEADSEDEEMENEIESNLDALHGAAGRLNQLARATGRELDEHNKHLAVVIGKVRHTIPALLPKYLALSC
jgi:hypothetical protein